MFKWDHYLEIYEKHFRRYVNKSPKVLEIGVCEGGSLDLWKAYFGTGCQIIGVDVNPACKDFEDEQTRIFIGNQADRNFLHGLIEQAGPFDIVIDDGGHRMTEQIVSFEELYPATADDGIYLVEDLHTSYWHEFGGGLGFPGTFVEHAKQIVDDLNGWHARVGSGPTFYTQTLTSMTFYDSVAVFEKTPRTVPFQIHA
jgi:hypothetical protein